MDVLLLVVPFAVGLPILGVLLYYTRRTKSTPGCLLSAVVACAGMFVLLRVGVEIWGDFGEPGARYSTMRKVALLSLFGLAAFFLFAFFEVPDNLQDDPNASMRQRATKALAICGVFFLITLGGLYLAFDEDRNQMSFARFHQDLDPLLSVYLAEPAADFSGESAPYIRGKMVIVDLDTKEIVNEDGCAFGQLEWERLARKPEDVGTVVWLQYRPITVGQYSDGSDAIQRACDITIIDVELSAVVGRTTLLGSEPPEVATSRRPGIGDWPDDDVYEFLKGLPDHASQAIRISPQRYASDLRLPAISGAGWSWETTAVYRNGISCPLSSEGTVRGTARYRWPGTIYPEVAVGAGPTLHRNAPRTGNLLVARTIIPSQDNEDIEGSVKDAVARLRELRAEFAEGNKDLTDTEREALIDRWVADVEAGLAEYVRRNPDKSDGASATFGPVSIDRRAASTTNERTVRRYGPA